jgi:hypothetical protein
VSKCRGVSKAVKEQLIKNFALVSHEDSRKKKEWVELEEDWDGDWRRNRSRPARPPAYFGGRNLTAHFIARSKAGYAMPRIYGT